MMAVLALTLLAGGLRFTGLNGPDGDLDTDEARVALSAVGVLESGLPVVPSGRIYTRGLLNSYLIAPAFGLLGRHDFAARLPSVVAGALLVPVVFLLGRALGGTAVGLAAGGFVALAEPLVEWSRSAWLPSIFLVLFTLSVYFGYRGFVTTEQRRETSNKKRETIRRGWWQLAAAGCFGLALLSYEFAVLFVGGLALYLLARLAKGGWEWYAGRFTLAAGGLLVGGVAVFCGLALALRAGTLAGPLGEVSHYVSPGTRLSGPAYYLEQPLGDYWLLIGVALAGLPAVARARPQGTLYLGFLLALAFLVPSFVIQAKREQHYALPVLPLLAVLAGAAAVRLARLAAARLSPGKWIRGWLPPMALLATFGITLAGDVAEAAGRFPRSVSGPSWLQEVRGRGLQPSELVLSEAPTIVELYLGPNEFYIHPEGYERYTYQAPDALRSIYTNSILLREQGDFERMVEQPYAGQTVWVVGREERLQRLAEMMDPNLLPSLSRSADEVIRTHDRWLLMRIKLPRQQ
jgi:4-amino-4-deoxy-L-arabinose transferase-like glycosyltransferase